MQGQRVRRKPDGGKLGWLAAGLTVAVLACVYLGLCVWSNGRAAILPNVSISGVDVSNLTPEQAQKALESAVAGQSGDIALTLSYDGLIEQLDTSLLTVDAAQSAQDAWRAGRENFLTSGAKLVGHMLGASSQVPAAFSLDGQALGGLLEGMREAVAGRANHSAYQIEDGQLVMTKGAPIATIDWEQARSDVEEALQDALEQRLSGQGGTSRDIPLPVSQSETKEPDFEAIHEELATEPKDASLDTQTMAVTDHAVGVDFDVQALRNAYQNASSGETFSIPVTVTQPKVTKDVLEAQLFKDLLGEGTTTVSGSANRKNNVKLSAEACNDVILLPGEEFSYNNTTGSRTGDKGYKNAPVYKAGQSVDDIGGGICQTSSTIYYAVLHTPLEVVERHAHQFNTGYVDLGMDATVFYGSLDFRFKNSTDYPVKIVTKSYDSNGKRYLNVKLYGTNPEGITAKPESVTFDKVAPTTVYKANDSVPQGSLVLDREQYAYTGWSAHTYRYIYDRNGNQLEKQDMGGSKYKMRPNTYFYNPADGDPSTWVDGKPASAPSTDPQPPVSDPTGGGQTPATDPNAGGQTPTTDPNAGEQTPSTDPNAGGQTPAVIDPNLTNPEKPEDPPSDSDSPAPDGGDGGDAGADGDAAESTERVG